MTNTTTTEHVHQRITVRDEDGAPLYLDCVERGCSRRWHPTTKAVTYRAANGRLVTREVSALDTEEALSLALGDAGIERSTIRFIQAV